jgi:hypothetical protein
MPTISQFFGIVIQMFWREHHSPPHVHALYMGNSKRLIDIRTPEDWGSCQAKQLPKRIPPLE